MCFGESACGRRCIFRRLKMRRVRYAWREKESFDCIMRACGTEPIVGRDPRRGAVVTRSFGTGVELEYNVWLNRVPLANAEMLFILHDSYLPAPRAMTLEMPTRCKGSKDAVTAGCLSS